MRTKYPSFFGILAALMLVVSFVVPTSLVSPSAVQADPGICKWDNLSEPGAAYGLYAIQSGNEILDYSIASDGTNVAAIVRLNYVSHSAVGITTQTNILLQSPAQTGLYWSAGKYVALMREVQWGATSPPMRQLYQVVYAPDNPNFFAVTSDGPGAGNVSAGPKEVWVTQNNGADWEITNFYDKLTSDNITGATIRTIDISVDYGGKRDIVVGLVDGNSVTDKSLYVVKSTGFTGWMGQETTALGDVDFFAAKFSPSYASDASLVLVFANADVGVVFGGTYYNVALRDLDANQIIAGTGWAFTLPGVEVVNPTKVNGGFSPQWFELNEANIELPSDFSGQAASLRRAYISLDTYACGAGKPAEDGIFRMDNNTVYVLMDTSALVDKSIYSIAYFGTYASGKLLAGDRIGYPCTATVPTYFTDSPTTCPIPCWYECLKCTTGAACGAGACNCPGVPVCAAGSKTGGGHAIVTWRPNGQLAFVATGGLGTDNGTTWYLCWATGAVTPCDESAFGISRNNGETWNQVSLIDTVISQFTDIAPSADCKTIYVASVNTGCFASSTSGPCRQSLKVWCDNSTGTPTFGWASLGATSCGTCNTSAGATFAGLLSGTYNPALCGCVYSVSGNWTYFCNCGAAGCPQWIILTPLTNQFVACSANVTIALTAACNCNACCPATTPSELCCGFDSVWRTSSNADVTSPIANLPVGTLWERVFTHTTSSSCAVAQSNVALLRLVPWCADPTGEIVGWAAYGQAVAAWSPDFGDYWAMITVRNSVQDFAFESRTMLYFLSSGGLVQKMPYTGTAWSTALPNYDSGLTYAHTIAAMPEGKVLVGKAYITPYATSLSLNMDTENPTFGLTTTAGPLGNYGNVHVAFDPKFDDNSIIYIAVDGATGSVYRNNPVAQLRWSDTDMLADSNGAVGCFPFGKQNGYSGIVLAYTGEALYASSIVTNAGVVRTIDDGTGKYGPLSSMPKPGIAWDQLYIGLAGGTRAVEFTAPPSALKACGCCTTETDTALYAIDYRPYTTPSLLTPVATVGRIWGFTDCLAKRGPSLITEDKTLIGCDPVSGRASEVNLCWEQLCVSNQYDLEIAKNADFSIRIIDLCGENGCGCWSPSDVTIPCAFFPAGGLATDAGWGLAEGGTASAIAAWGNLECGHTYYWRVKARACATTQPIRSAWSEARSFSVKAGLPIVASYSGLQLLSPANGMIGLPVKSASFSWAPLGENTKYKFILAKDGNLTQIVKEAEVTNTAYSYDGTLDYSTAYFWKVQCVEPACDSSPTFSLMTESAPPATEEAAKAPPTPFWVWVVIAIGAILVIVTLVLIFKTRRV